MMLVMKAILIDKLYDILLNDNMLLLDWTKVPNDTLEIQQQQGETIGSRQVMVVVLQSKT